MTGLQMWVAERVQAARDAACWLIGHSMVVGEWKRSQYTVATHCRDHRCTRCGREHFEQGYFNALERGKGGEADTVPW